MDQPTGSSEPQDPVDPRANPNLFRDRSANERTFLAWLRTGITVTALGFVVARFELLLFEVAQLDNREFDQSELAILIGLMLVAAGPLLVIAAAVRYYRADRALLAAGPMDRRGSLRMVFLVSAGLGIAGLGMVGHLIAAWPT